MEWKPFEHLTLQAPYIPVRTVKAKATYEVFRPLRVYAGFDWDDDWYLAPTASEQVTGSSAMRSA